MFLLSFLAAALGQIFHRPFRPTVVFTREEKSDHCGGMEGWKTRGKLKNPRICVWARAEGVCRRVEARI